MNTLKKYKGYLSTIELDSEDGIFVGRVVGIRDGINFHGTSVDELEAAFHESVDDYLAACEQLGQQPNKPYSGNLMLRIPTDVHAAVAAAAETSGKSINQWATTVLDEASHAH